MSDEKDILKEPFLPGFEKMEDKELKAELIKLVDDFIDNRAKYSTPAKVATWESKVKAIMERRVELFKSKEKH